MYLSDVVLNDIQVGGANDAAKYGRYGLSELAANGAAHVDYLMPEAMAQMATVGDNIDVKSLVLKDQVVEVREVASFDIPSNLADYTTQKFVAYDVYSGIKIFPSTYKGSMANMESDVRIRLQRVFRDMAKKKEEILSTVLESQKTQVLDYTTQASQNEGTYSFDTSADVLNITKDAQKSNMYYTIQNLMDANELGGEYDILTSRLGVFSSVVEGNDNSAQNAVNHSWGKVPSANVFESNQISAGSNNFNGWAIRKGALALVENHPYDFANGTQIGEEKWSVSNTVMPFINSRPNIFVNSGSNNSTSLVNSSDNIMAAYEEMGIWDKFYVLYSYNEDASTIPNPIVKLAGLNS